MTVRDRLTNFLIKSVMFICVAFKRIAVAKLSLNCANRMNAEMEDSFGWISQEEVAKSFWWQPFPKLKK